ncbi:unnamed protein product [Clonostachys rosea]|uniref:Zn(2)-C6 fungal-type domain-containing protein n=1 Tax=Bionectria ochroleuca TaxID=29856 RepID=A0ABY6TTN5_BIOOC|nr:unnamed protein product [Clonostachys rosea]
MADLKGTRSRDGCYNCRRRKRRCDKQKPICMSCRKNGGSCVFPSVTNSLKFVVSVAPTEHLIPFEESIPTSAFFHTSAEDVATLSLESDPGTPESGSDGHGDCQDDTTTKLLVSPVKLPAQLTLSKPISSGGIHCNNPVELSLIQYYVEVIGASKVFSQTDQNLFLTSVMPRILNSQGPLQSTVLAMSAGEWRDKPVAHGRAGFELSAYYKSRALGELQRSLWENQCAEENLLTCVLLASLDISHGSRATWLRHLHGAFALLEKFSPTIDPEVSTFALKYFRFRYTLLQTTHPRIIPACYSLTDSAANEMHEMTHWFMDDLGAPSSNNAIDEHTGCSSVIADIIAQISTLALQSNANSISREKIQNVAHHLEHRLSVIGSTPPATDDAYLANSAESFRYAAHIYLLLACFDMPIKHASVIDLHHILMDYLTLIIVKDQKRRLFPMWPLFIAGCTCSCDEQRKAVIDLFTILEDQWPVSNVSAVWSVLRTIWQARDLSVACQPTTKRLDWQDIIHRFGWKLSLT